MRFAFIDQNKDAYGVQIMCDVLDVSRSGYYAWKSRPRSARAERREELAGQIAEAYRRGRGVYGSPRVYEELKAKGVKACENTVAKVMREQGIRSKVTRRFRVRTTDSCHDRPVAGNALGRDFAVERPDKVWAADITYVHTGEGFLYLAAVIDLCSRKVVGWAMADHLRAELCLDALGMALERRRPGRGLLHHSDRGVQYASDDYQRLLAENGIRCSMSRGGDCYDNAVAESFWGTLKTELVNHERYETREQARASVFEYVEVFYNRQRLHSSLGYLSPEQFERSLN